MKKNHGNESVCLRFLYETIPGRIILKVLVSKNISVFAGKFLDSRFSRVIIPQFVKNNNIDLSEYEKKYCSEYQSFNEFFCRKIRSELRPKDVNKNDLMSPCDGLLSVYKINKDLVMPIKQSKYSINSLLRDKKLAKEYEDGYCLVFRLCVNHYHRYCFFDGGIVEKRRKIKGVLHTVRPIALMNTDVFVQNSREYCIIESDNFGKAIQMEVGAMLVGKIDNYNKKKRVERGEEKGRFLYGGSTIIILLKKDEVVIEKELFEKTNLQQEVPVKMGQCIGNKPELKNSLD